MQFWGGKQSWDMRKVVIVGSGGHAKVIMNILRVLKIMSLLDIQAQIQQLKR